MVKMNRVGGAAVGSGVARLRWRPLAGPFLGGLLVFRAGPAAAPGHSSRAHLEQLGCYQRASIHPDQSSSGMHLQLTKCMIALLGHCTRAGGDVDASGGPGPLRCAIDRCGAPSQQSSVSGPGIPSISVPGRQGRSRYVIFNLFSTSLCCSGWLTIK